MAFDEEVSIVRIHIHRHMRIHIHIHAHMHTQVSIVRGKGWEEYRIERGYYVGNTPAVPRLRVPSINIQDGPQGFRAPHA